MSQRQRLGWRLLVTASSGLIVFGLLLVLLPQMTLQGFSLLVYGSTARLATFGSDAVAYIRLVHAVLGAVMVGWGALFLFLALGPIGRGSRDAWLMFTASLAAWFIPDSTYSLVSGFWQNAVLNLAFALLFAGSLAALKPYCKRTGT